MKQKLVKFVRNTLPHPLVRAAEEAYRRGRVYAVSARYGFPAKNLRVIAVTGTNGKTTTANYLNEILKVAGNKTALFSTAIIEVAGERVINDLNATVALTAQMQQFLARAKAAKVDYVVLEITSHALDQHKLATVPIECAIMTNLTQDHLDYHGTMERYAAAKAKLFAVRPRYIVLNHDDQWFEYFDDYEADEHKLTYGSHPKAEAQITSVTLYKKGSEVQLEIDHQTKLELATSLPGSHNVYNLVAAASAAYLLHTPLDAIREGIANVTDIPGRFERIEGRPFDIVVDYAHTPDALEQLLGTARQISKGDVWLVFGACGDRDKAKRPIMGAIAAKNADYIVLTDEESYNEDPLAIRDMLRQGIVEAAGEAKMTELADRREAIAYALTHAKTGDIVLVTGMGHEQYRIIEGKKEPWNDADEIRKLLA